MEKDIPSGGYNMTNTMDVITFSSVVKRGTVCIALTIVVLHNLEVGACDVLNAYVKTPNREKIWTVSGPEFVDNAGKSAITVRVLCGLKSAVLCLEHILQNVFGNEGIGPVMQTLTCG